MRECWLFQSRSVAAILFTSWTWISIFVIDWNSTIFFRFVRCSWLWADYLGFWMMQITFPNVLAGIFPSSNLTVLQVKRGSSLPFKGSLRLRITVFVYNLSLTVFVSPGWHTIKVFRDRIKVMKTTETEIYKNTLKIYQKFVWQCVWLQRIQLQSKTLIWADLDGVCVCPSKASDYFIYFVCSAGNQKHVQWDNASQY